MPEQPELFDGSAFFARPAAGATGPDLWVRRLTLWKAPGEPIRSIELRPGLNLIWSPDPAEVGSTADADALGHGAGKTLFCRLLRYCLGEDRFAPEAQRQSISQTLLQGWVSAEVMLIGELWGVLRPLSGARKHFAVRGTQPEKLFERLDAPTGMQSLLDAIESQILSRRVADLIPSEERHDAWRVALAWLTRDQECRFDHVLDWRSVESDSDSPTRAMSRARLQHTMRVLIGAISPEEIELQQTATAESETHKALASQLARQQWSSERLHRALMQTLDLQPESIPEGRLGLEALRASARRQLAQVAQVKAGIDVSDLSALRQRWRESEQQAARIAERLAGLQGSLQPHKALQLQYQSELPLSSARVRDAQVPVCLLCEVPIDRVRAEGCKLSNKLPDFEGLSRRHQDLIARMETQAVLIESVEQEIHRLEVELRQARSDSDALRLSLAKAEHAAESRSLGWFRIRRCIDDIELLAREQQGCEELQARLAESQLRSEALKDGLAGHRKQHGKVLERLSTRFDAAIRTLAGKKASASVSLDGNGLQLRVLLGGERTTAAIESLKVIAFDLAVMSLSIEGETHLPAFLIHDSPREADLGLSLYHRVLEMVAALEGTESSTFQYIVTTTTQPQPQLQRRPWLRETLRGAPPSERLLRCDLP